MLVYEFDFCKTHAESFLVALDTQNCPVVTHDFAVAVFNSPEGKKIEPSNRRYLDNKTK